METDEQVRMRNLYQTDAHDIQRCVVVAPLGDSPPLRRADGMRERTGNHRSGDACAVPCAAPRPRLRGSSGFETYNKSFVGAGNLLETPLSRAVVEAVSAHVAKFLPPDSLVAMTARHYQRNFTEAQLRDLLAFYEGPTGMRFLEAQARIGVATKADADRVLSSHAAELQRALEAIVRPPMERE
jgi:hypothetical protein